MNTSSRSSASDSVNEGRFFRRRSIQPDEKPVVKIFDDTFKKLSDALHALKIQQAAEVEDRSTYYDFIFPRNQNLCRNGLLKGEKLGIKVQDPHMDKKEKKVVYEIVVELESHRWIIYKTTEDFNKVLSYIYGLQALHEPIILNESLETDEPVRTLKFLPVHSKTPPAEAIEKDKHDLQAGLNTLVNCPGVDLLPNVMKFFCISHFTLAEHLGPPVLEGSVLKKSGGRIKTGVYNMELIRSWEKRWLVIKDSYIFYSRDVENLQVGDVFLMDRDFSLQKNDDKREITIKNSRRELCLRFRFEKIFDQWVGAIERMTNSYPSQQLVEPNRFLSFAPVRHGSYCRWFVDGAAYFHAVEKILRIAKDEIFISAWYLTPGIWLTRGTNKDDNVLLLDLLKEKSEEGVKIFILMYHEVHVILPLMSKQSKELLASSKNIRVMRSPWHISDKTLKWSHHEKMVIIDQTYCFFGGLDLCFGRWDDQQHKIADICNNAQNISTSLETINSDSSGFADKADTSSSNSSLNDSAVSVQLSTSAEASLIDQDISNDIKEVISECGEVLLNSEEADSDSLKLTPVTVRAVDSCESFKSASSRHEIMSLRGNWGKLLIRVRFLVVMNHYLETARSRKKLMAGDLYSIETDPNNPRWKGRDYANFFIRDVIDPHNYNTDLIDRQTIARLPWHDVGAFGYGEIARDLARYFILRWNFVKEQHKKTSEKYPVLFPRTYHSIPKTLDPKNPDSALVSQLDRIKKLIGPLFRMRSQGLRSLSSWSSGIREVECSIQTAYINAIQSAKKFIYIENQFFISMVGDGKKAALNGIANALYERIMRAHNHGEEFRVFIVMPLLPAFEGGLLEPGDSTLKHCLYNEYFSLFREKFALFPKLEKQIKDPTKYIDVYGLRAHDYLNGKHTSELLYVHSKVLIVDDEYAIIGSANINDRSMLGSRDSEVAVYLEDEDKVMDVLGGKPHMAGMFVSSLRKTLFREHLGLKDDSLKYNLDPLSDDFYYKVWRNTAQENTDIYKKVFKCIPSDEAVDLNTAVEHANAKDTLAHTDPAEAANCLEKIRGALVCFPRFFFSKQDPPSSKIYDNVYY